ncbi:MAG TPA: hypothetical protein VFQ83_14405 [Candidatus Udaeobacter sp.]|jgi:hypothetical protein|nr:hypothetical protein [Candidatus Udaeobacter sp.]
MTISCFIKRVLRGEPIKFVAAETATLIDKRRPSRRERVWRFGGSFFGPSLALAVLIGFPSNPVQAITLSHADVLKIGKKIWQNECNGTISGLTSWNQGEDFASLGIGHFIWYPKGQRGPFEESFPEVVSFISKRGAKLPALLLGRADKPCPWNSRTEFLQAQHSAQMSQLRQFLTDTIDLQAEFLLARLQAALPKMLAEAAPSERANVQEQFERLTRTPQGCYALIDYVNFKGEGVLHTERYQGQGWGLLQVLEAMRGTSDKSAVDEFARAARTVLTRRVQNSPAERHESRWLSGWIRRVNSYNGG